MKLVKQFTIDRATWFRGNGGGLIAGDNSKLRRQDGQRCCLGFYLEACRVERALTLGRGSPGTIARETGKSAELPEWLLDSVRGSDSFDSRFLMELNDEREVEEREERIAAVFAKHGVKVVYK